MAYAKYLSSELHAGWNQVVRANFTKKADPVLEDKAPPVTLKSIHAHVAEHVLHGRITKYQALDVVIAACTVDVFVVDGEPYVSLPAICRPFNKKPNDQLKLELERIRAEGRARTRLTRAPSAGGAQHTACVRAQDVPMVVPSFSSRSRGMTAEIKAGWAQFTRECADVLDSYFVRGVAPSPRFSEEQRREAFEEDNEKIAKGIPPERRQAHGKQLHRHP